MVLDVSKNKFYPILKSYVENLSKKYGNNLIIMWNIVFCAEEEYLYGINFKKCYKVITI